MNSRLEKQTCKSYGNRGCTLPGFRRKGRTKIRKAFSITWYPWWNVTNPRSVKVHTVISDELRWRQNTNGDQIRRLRWIWISARALETAQPMRKEPYRNYKATQDVAAGKEFMKYRSSLLKITSKLEMHKTEDPDMSEKKDDDRKSPTVKPDNFDSSKPVEAFLQQFRACTQCYKWTETESVLQMKCALSGDATSLVWSQINPEQLTTAHLQELLWLRYDSAKQEDKFQAEQRAHRRIANEDLPTLRADISRVISLAFPGDISEWDRRRRSTIFWIH